jgi:Zinc-binding dehydrogenase
MFAVQLAGILGGHVTVTGRSTDAGFVRDLGAQRFISAGAAQPGPAAGGFDVVIDTVGGAVLEGSYGLLREGGQLVLGAPPDQELAGRHQVHAMFFVVEPDAGELARLAELAGTGRLRAVISQTSRWLKGGRPSKAAQGSAGPARRSWSFADLPSGSPRSASGASRCLTRGHGKAGRAAAPAPEQARARRRRGGKELAKLRKIRFLLAMCLGSARRVRQRRRHSRGRKVR